MQFLHGVLRSLQQEPAVHDSVPDLITLSSYALANLANNGASLDLINAAHTVVDAGVAALVSAMSTLYADRYVAVIAALPSLRTASLADRVMVPLNKLLTKVCFTRFASTSRASVLCLRHSVDACCYWECLDSLISLLNC